MKNLNLLIALLLTSNYIMAQNMYVRIADPAFVPNVKMEPNSTNLKLMSRSVSYNNLLSQYNVKHFKQAFPTAKSNWLKQIYYIEIQQTDNQEPFVEGIRRLFSSQIPLVEEVGDCMLTGDLYIPNDSIYQQGMQTNLSLIRAPEAWAITKKYGQVKVGITDTYFYSGHEDLHFDSIWHQNINVYKGSDHGTVVAGCLAAVTNNSIGIAAIGGLNSALTVSPMIGSDNEVLLLAQAGCRVINCSWLNRCSYSEVQDSLYSEIRNDWDCVVVFGAGNVTDHCGSLDAKVYPSSYENCVSVTSVGHKYPYGHGLRENWQDVHNHYIDNPSSAHHHNDAVDICAPGYSIKSTCYWNGIYYSTGATGTSFAAPQVAGVAAMVRAVNPNLTANEVVDILKTTADSSIYNIPENVPYIGLLGTGRLDAYAAVKKACSVDIKDVVYSSDEEIQGCFISAENTKITNANIEFNGTIEVVLIKNFTVELGSTLNIP